MTLLLALYSQGGLVLAADSRALFDGTWEAAVQHDRERKERILAPHAAILFGGSAELGQQIIHEVEDTLHEVGALDGVTAVMHIFRDTARGCYEDWFPRLPPTAVSDGPNRPDLGFVLAGYDLDEAGRYGRARIFQLQSRFDFAPMQQDCGFAVLGVVPYAVYLLNRLYDQGRTLDEVTSLAVFCVTETANQDSRVGGLVRVIQITAAGATELPGDRVEEVIRSNSLRWESMTEVFYGAAERRQSAEMPAMDVNRQPAAR